MEQNYRTRQQNDTRMIRLLEDIEKGQPNIDTIEILMKLHIDNQSSENKENIMKRATYIFTTHADKNKHNCQKLLSICSKENPLACLKCQDLCIHGKYKTKHFEKSIPLRTHLCLEAKVAIKGTNFEPIWGLYNGAIGTVKEIVFADNKNPNIGDLPLYVAVEFQSYKPPNSVPSFDKMNPKVIPIPIVTAICKNSCCRINFCPLVIGFGRTIHSFQGQEVGPDKPIQHIIVNPGKK